MKKAKKALLLILCAILLVVGSVMGTLAYLTMETKEVKNTFTVGKVSFGEVDSEGKAVNGLDEAAVDEYGALLYKTDVDGKYSTTGTVLAPRVLANTYKLIPGHKYVKDPTVHVAAGSEACYLYVYVNNGISEIETGTTIAQQMTANGWQKVQGYNVYAKEIAATTDATDVTDYVVFSEFTIKNDADFTNYMDANGKVTAEISVIAYAVQKDGLADVKTAWENTFNKYAEPANNG